MSSDWRETAKKHSKLRKLYYSIVVITETTFLASLGQFLVLLQDHMDFMFISLGISVIDAKVLEVTTIPFNKATGLQMLEYVTSTVYKLG